MWEEILCILIVPLCLPQSPLSTILRVCRLAQCSKSLKSFICVFITQKRNSLHAVIRHVALRSKITLSSVKIASAS